MGMAASALLLLIAAAGCLPFGRGTYPVDIFAEMHYTQSYKSQEPPRLYPAPGAVPFMSVGAGPLMVEEMTPAMSTATAEKGGELYAVNCIACHGQAGKGDGPMRAHLMRVGSIVPADVTGAATVNTADDDLFTYIGSGGRIGFAFRLAGQPSTSTMPEFDKLLTPEERWSLVYYLRDLQSQ